MIGFVLKGLIRGYYSHETNIVGKRTGIMG